MAASDLVTRTKNWFRAEIPNSLRAFAKDLREGKPVEAPAPQFLEEAADEIERLQKQYEERTPTEWAYNKACGALHKWRDRARELEATQHASREMYEALKALVEEYGSARQASDPWPLLDAYDLASSALAKFEEMPLPDQWQAIQTAPAFTNVDVWLEGNETIGREPNCRLDDEGWKYFTSKGWLPLETHGIKATHWMPLPQPPQPWEEE